MNIDEVVKTIAEIEALAGFEYRSAQGVLRYGQCLFNATFDIVPDIANKIRGSSTDPFYVDHIIPKFFTQLEEFLLEEI